MNIEFVDTHVHLTCDQMFKDVDNIIKRGLQAKLVGFVNINTSLKEFERGQELSKRYKNVYNTLGIPPHNLPCKREMLEEVYKKINKKDLVAIGEVGLDYHYFENTKEIQKEVLKEFLSIAKEVNLPLVFHCRGKGAFEDLFEITKDCNSPVVVHCFTGSSKDAEIAIERGWNLSVGGIVTLDRGKELREVLKNVPLSNLFLETDAPYLSPRSVQFELNEPKNLVEIAMAIGPILNLSFVEICRETTKNAKKFFAF